MSQEKHDGKLEGRNTYTVQHIFGLSMPEVASVKIGHDEVSTDEVWLSPKQALSLLAWLEQERATLEQLAKEQGCYVCGHLVATEIGTCQACKRLVCEEHGDLYKGWMCQACIKQARGEPILSAKEQAE